MFFYKGPLTDAEKLQTSLSYSGYNEEILSGLLKDKARRLIAFHGDDDSLKILDEVGTILDRLDPAPSTILQAVDAKGQDFGTYFVATYSDTRDFERSIVAYKAIKNLIRYVLLMDRFYEVGNERYHRIAKALIANIGEKSDICSRYLLNCSLKQFWPFWSFEQKVKRLMIKGHKFSAAEIRHFNLLKSSDAPIIYCSILESMAPSFNPNVSLIIHYNQALQDIEDDFDDIEEDIRDRMPNVFVLAALTDHECSYGQLLNSPKRDLSTLVVRNASTVRTIVDLIDQYSRNIENVEIPEQFHFLKLLSKGYAERIKKKLHIYTSKNSVNTHP